MLTRPTCENACGKLPTSRFAAGSYSSDSKPHVVSQTEQTLVNALGFLSAI